MGMSDKTIRVSEETWRDLNDRKREGESFDDVIRRLRGDKWRGFGALADTGVADGMERIHTELEAEFEADIEEMDR
jgi:predicted CopG family antitoxin